MYGCNNYKYTLQELVCKVRSCRKHWSQYNANVLKTVNNLVQFQIEKIFQTVTLRHNI